MALRLVCSPVSFSDEPAAVETARGKRRIETKRPQGVMFLEPVEGRIMLTEKEEQQRMCA